MIFWRGLIKWVYLGFGTQLAFVSERDGNSEIYIVNVDGTGLTRLTDDPAEDLHPAWSPPG